MNRIITVIDQYSPFGGGAENIAKFIVEKSSNKSITHNVLTIANNEIDEIYGKRLPAEEIINDNCRIYRFRYATINGKEKNGPVFKYITLLKYILHLIKLKNTFDLIHAHTFYWPAFAAIVAGKIIRKPVIVTGHNTLARLQEEVQEKQVNSYLLSILKHSNCFIAINDSIAQEAETICSIPPDRIKVIYNGIDTKKYKPVSSAEEKKKIRSTLALPLSKQIIMYHGRLDSSKNVQTLIKAVKLIVEKNVHDVFLVIIGEGPSSDELMDLVNKSNINEQVCFFGFKNNIDEFLNASDIHCLPSFFEGMPLALLEAMSSGLSCVCSDNEGNRSVLTDKYNGFVFETTNAQQLSDMLSMVIEDRGKEYVNEIRSNGRKTVLEKYSLDMMCENYMSLYSEM